MKTPETGWQSIGYINSKHVKSAVDLPPEDAVYLNVPALNSLTQWGGFSRVTIEAAIIYTNSVSYPPLESYICRSDSTQWPEIQFLVYPEILESIKRMSLSPFRPSYARQLNNGLKNHLFRRGIQQNFDAAGTLLDGVSLFTCFQLIYYSFIWDGKYQAPDFLSHAFLTLGLNASFSNFFREMVIGPHGKRSGAVRSLFWGAKLDRLYALASCCLSNTVAISKTKYTYMKPHTVE